MSIQLDGYRVGRTQRLEDLTSDLSTSLGATVDQIWIENPTSSISRMNSLDAAMTETVLTDQIGEPIGPLGDIGADFAPRPDFTYKDQQRKSISKQEADKKVSEAGVKLDIGENGIPEAALTILIERKREEVKRQALIDSAPSGFWSGAAQIGTGLAVSLADPIGVASAFIPIVGQARYAKLLAGASSAGARAGVRAGVGAVEGVVGAAIIEPIVLLAANAEQADYGLYDSYMNLVFGAVLGGGLHTGLGAIGDAVGKSSAATKESLLRAAVGQAMDDKPIDVGYVAQTDSSFQKAWLDTTTEARLSRAREQGFDTETVLFHGTASNIEEFTITTTKKGKEIPIFLTPSTAVANKFAKQARGEAPNVLPVFVNIKSTFDFRNADHIDQLRGTISDKRIKEIEDGEFQALEKKEVIKAMKDKGFDSFNVLEGGRREAFAEADRVNSKEFPDTKEGKKQASSLFKEKSKEWEEIGQKLDRLKPKIIKSDQGFVIEHQGGTFKKAGEEAEIRGTINVAVFDPKNIRSINSKFDPDAIGVSNLLGTPPKEFSSPSPKLDAKSPEANPVAAKEAQETIDNKLDETPETLDTLTNDIMTALDDAGIDSVAVRSEIDVINKQADQEAAGMREALMCMIGK